MYIAKKILLKCSEQNQLYLITVSQPTKTNIYNKKNTQYFDYYTKKCRNNLLYMYYEMQKESTMVNSFTYIERTSPGPDGIPTHIGNQFQNYILQRSLFLSINQLLKVNSPTFLK